MSFSEQDIAEMKRLHAKGLSFAKIGKRFKVSSKTVQYWIDGVYREKNLVRKRNWDRKQRKIEKEDDVEDYDACPYCKASEVLLVVEGIKPGIDLVQCNKCKQVMITE